MKEVKLEVRLIILILYLILYFDYTLEDVKMGSKLSIMVLPVCNPSNSLGCTVDPSWNLTVRSRSDTVLVVSFQHRAQRKLDGCAGGWV